MLGERINEAMKGAKWSQTRLAKEVGLAQPSIHAILHNKANPRKTTIDAIARALNVLVDWLLTGEGAMISPKIDHESEEIAQLCAGLQPEQRDLVKRTAERLAHLEDLASTAKKAAEAPLDGKGWDQGGE